MNKTELVDTIAEKFRMTKKETSQIVNSTFETIATFLAEEAKKEPKYRQGVLVIGF